MEENLNLQKIIGSGNRKKLKEELSQLKKLKEEKNKLIDEIEKKYPRKISDDIWRLENKIKFAFSNQEFLLIDNEGDLRISKVEFNSRGQIYHEGFTMYYRESFKKNRLICPKEWITYFVITNNEIVFGFKSKEHVYYIARQNLETKEIRVHKI